MTNFRREKIMTLCILHNDEKILLGMKKRGFGQGKWNGFGGKVQDGESIEKAAEREITEEAGITAHNLTKRGIITFEFEDDPVLLKVHVFSASGFDGEPQESDEMKPSWFELSEIPFNEMWPDDRYWMPLLFAGKNFNAYFKFRGHDTILSRAIEEIQ